MNPAPYYDDGTVTIYHGDCRDVDAWLAAEVVVTDPPYGIGASSWTDSNRPAIIGEPRMNRSSRRVIGPEFVALRDAALALWPSPRPALCFGSWRAPRPNGTRLRLIWDRCSIGIGGFGPWRPTDEEIYVLGDGWPDSKPMSNIIRVQTIMPGHRRCHPNEKPLALMEQLVSWCPAGVVADPFMGSGSTLVAARSQGRRAVGVEIDEKHCEIAAKRLAQQVLTGEGAA